MAVATKKKPPKTLAQIQMEQAAAQVAAAVTPAKTEIQKAIAQAEAERAAAMRGAEGLATAVGKLSAGDAGQARDAYAAAAERIASYGSGFTGALKNTQSAAAAGAEELIRRMGIAGPVVSTAADNADVTRYASATIPATSLAAEAARALANLNDHRLAAGLRVQDTALAGDYKAREGVGDLRQKILDLEAKRPGLLASALDEIQKAKNQERALNVQVGTLQLSQAKSAQDTAIAMTNLTGTLHVVQGGKVVDTGRIASGSAAGKSQTAAATSTANAAAAAAAKVEAARVAAEAKRDAATIAAAKKTGKAIPTATVSAVTQRARTTGAKTVDSLKNRVWEGVGYQDPIQGQNETPDAFAARKTKLLAAATAEYRRRLTLNYGTAMAQVRNAIAPHLRLLGYKPEAIRAFAKQIVVAQITPPTASGSPGGP